MHSVNLHQTSGHAVLIVHLPSIDPASVTSQISPSHHSAEISFNHTNSNSKILATTVLVLPVLTQQEQQQRPSHTGLIQECSYSVSSENIVIRFKKTCPPCEWQALQLDFKTHSSTSNGELSASSTTITEMEGVVEQAGGGESSVVAKFVTVANTTSFQEAIQSQPLWDQAGSHVIGNVQAKRVPGMNAIQMTAELVPPSS